MSRLSKKGARRDRLVKVNFESKKIYEICFLLRVVQYRDLLEVAIISATNADTK